MNLKRLSLSGGLIEAPHRMIRGFVTKIENGMLFYRYTLILCYHVISPIYKSSFPIYFTRD